MGRSTTGLGTAATAAVVAGVLALTATGVAGAAASTPAASSSTSTTTTSTTTTAPTVPPTTQAGLTPAQSRRVARFSCSRSQRALGRITRGEADLAAGLPRLHKAQARASGDGNTRRADRIAARIERLEKPAVTARLRALAQAIEAKCDVSAPATGSSTAG